jgi:hypothetical protein
MWFLLPEKRFCYLKGGPPLSCTSYGRARYGLSTFRFTPACGSAFLAKYTDPCLVMAQFDREASQARDYCVATCATHCAARPDPSPRKERSLGMTIKLSHYPSPSLQQLRLFCAFVLTMPLRVCPCPSSTRFCTKRPLQTVPCSSGSQMKDVPRSIMSLPVNEQLFVDCLQA